MQNINISREENIQLIFDFIHRAEFHHVMWFQEVSKHLGTAKAYEILSDVYEKSFDNQKKRLSKTFNVDLNNNLPSNLIYLSDEKLIELLENIAINWLANDGIWFQEVEFTTSMNDAKHCNDECWAQFSPFEAWSIKKFLKMHEFPGLDGLKKALNYRLYCIINKQSVNTETENSFVFQMDDCRVQSARKRKNLADYPCKSAGIIEYTEFVKAIDPRIKTECICCPPDTHPESHFCAWRFYL